MQEFILEVKKTVWQAVLFIAFLIAGAFLEGRTGAVYGFLLGSFTGVIYFLLMSFRLKKAAGQSLSKAVFSMRLGWFIRFIFVVLMLILSMKLTYIDFWAAVVGLFSLHIIIFLNAVVTMVKTSSK